MILLEVTSSARSLRVADEGDQEINVLKSLDRNMLFTFNFHSAVAEQ